MGFWGMAIPVANFIGFTSSGIASGSTAAAWMSSAAIANGGGVATGSAVAVLQSIGAVGLATPIGLGLVAGGATVGAAAYLAKPFLSKTEDDVKTEASPESSWVLVELSTNPGKPKTQTFDDENEAITAFQKSTADSKALFDPANKLVLTHGWKVQ
ncbi:hypothetical protein BBO99_00002229 [Phytophthora kernoviae]|uniref:Uncharacterized protein n=1 Tax=Phytophthora kernoviae TaxID=325452 RepID=A0A3R7FYE0_9STRA|nr:hypothetical protein BBI17_007161 [Phytophthora kernoviae]RLN83319.1 hypothetical protein BBO99_00002229 [Phytophthora kernoviae]